MKLIVQLNTIVFFYYFKYLCNDDFDFFFIFATIMRFILTHFFISNFILLFDPIYLVSSNIKNVTFHTFFFSYSKVAAHNSNRDFCQFLTDALLFCVMPYHSVTLLAFLCVLIAYFLLHFQGYVQFIYIFLFFFSIFYSFIYFFIFLLFHSIYCIIIISIFEFLLHQCNVSLRDFFH